MTLLPDLINLLAGGGGGGSLGRVGVLPPEVVIDPAFSLNDCDIPRLPNRDVKASFTDGLVFIRMRVVSLNKCECFAVSSEKEKKWWRL